MLKQIRIFMFTKPSKHYLIAFILTFFFFADLTGEQGDVHLVLCDISFLSSWHPVYQHGSKEFARRFNKFSHYKTHSGRHFEKQAF